jgi:hypothetical protein
MASMGGAYLDPEPTARLVKTYVNKFLQQICVGEGMSKFGVKAELQNRIIDSMSHPSLVQDMSDPEVSDIHCYLIRLFFKIYISKPGFGTLNGISESGGATFKHVSVLSFEHSGLREYAAKGDVRAFESFQRTIQNAPHTEAHLYSGMAGSLSSINTPATPSGYLNNGGGSNIGGGSGYRIHGHPSEFSSPILEDFNVQLSNVRLLMESYLLTLCKGSSSSQPLSMLLKSN